MAEKDLRINEGIRVREVRLIDADGNQKGIVPTFEALRMARAAALDLVEIAPQAQPPVCKILDYGKYKFELEKKAREARKHQKQVQIKEIRMQPKIDKHDLDFKTRHVREFLDEGDKVKVTGGGYSGSEGVVESLDGDLAKVKVESFGMPMSVRIPVSQLEKVNG